MKNLTTSGSMSERLFSLLDVVLHNVPTHKLVGLCATLTVFSWITFFDVALRASGTVATIVVAAYAVRNYIVDYRIKKRQLKKMEEEEAVK